MNRIKELRLAKGISMAEAARGLHMPYTTYVNYEKGEREPNSETLISLANYYNCTIDYLIGLDNNFNVNDNGNTKKDSIPSFLISYKEKNVVIAYRNKPDMQNAVDTLLGIDNQETSGEIIKIAARDGSFTETTITDDEAKRISDLPDVDDL